MRSEKVYWGKKSTLCAVGLITALLWMVFSLRVCAAEENSIPQTSSAKLYTEMSDNSGIIANLIVGNEFEIVSEQLDDNGSRWYKVRTAFGSEGYAKASELDKLIIDANELLYSASIAAANAAQAPEANPGEGEGTSDLGIDQTGGQPTDDTTQTDGQQEPDADQAGGDPTPDADQAGGDQTPEAANPGEQQPSDTTQTGAQQPSDAIDPEGDQTPDTANPDGQQIPDAASPDADQTPDAANPGEELPPEGENLVGEEPVETVPESSAAGQEGTTMLASGAGFGEVDNTDSDINPDGFTVIERTDEPKEKLHGKIDAVLIMIVAGGVLCIIAIAALLKRILSCVRMEA